MDDTLHQLLAEVAAMYYEDEMTQGAIADHLGLSRVKVYRLLKQARAEQVVEISINWPLTRNTGLEDALCRAFNLKECLVLQADVMDPSTRLRLLGRLGARHLERVLQDGMTLAVCLGRSTYEVIHAVRPGFQARVHVAQAMGSMPFAMGELDSAALARQLAGRLGGQVLYLSSPLLAESAADAEVLIKQRDVQRTLDAARRADVALLGIGSLNPETSGFVRAGFTTAADLAHLKEAGAVGDVAGRIFDATGRLHTCDINARVIGVDFDALRSIPTTIAVAMGRDKASAILGALRAGILDVLCTDEEVAAHIVAMLTA